MVSSVSTPDLEIRVLPPAAAPFTFLRGDPPNGGLLGFPSQSELQIIEYLDTYPEIVSSGTVTVPFWCLGTA